jgi:iron complex transport system substrate-binding protein
MRGIFFLQKKKYMKNNQIRLARIIPVIITLSLILLSLSFAAGCRISEPHGGITDDLGRVVQITDTPRRIISLAPSNTEILYALGLEDRLIGVTTYCNYPPEALDKPKVSEFSNVDIEKLVALQPDLILADNLHKSDVIPALEKLGLSVLAIDPANLDRVIDDIEMIGLAAGQTQAAESLISTLRDRLTAVNSKVSELDSSERIRAFFLTWYDPLWTAGSGTLIDDLITRAGGINIAGDLKGHSQIDLEAVIQRNPQVILVMSSMGEKEMILNYIRTESRFQVTDALKNNRVYVIEADIFGRTSQRSVDGLEYLAGLMYPELFN